MKSLHAKNTYKISIFTDGSSRGNPGPGGWGAIVVVSFNGTADKFSGDTDVVKELGGGENKTTNNRMELMAVAKALSFLNDLGDKKNISSVGLSIDIYTDSSYLINGITKWVCGWKKNGWKTKTKDDVLNKDLWLEIDYLLSGGSGGSHSQNIKWHHIGGHIGIVGNERCDLIATAFADGDKSFKLYEGSLAKYKEIIEGRDILDISHDTELLATKKSAGTRSNAKAYSYVSKVDGVIETHKTWLECEKRVKGTRGARFKKSLSIGEEHEIINSFKGGK